LKLSFSTRGWSGRLDWDEMLPFARECRFDGVEIHDPLGEAGMVSPQGPFHPGRIMSSLRQLRENRLSLACLDSRYDLSSSDSYHIANLTRLIKLASDLRCQYVCVCAFDDKPDQIRRTLNDAVKIAGAFGVVILIRTCGVFCDTSRLRQMLDEYACDELAVAWDIYDTCRLAAENPADSIKNLGAYVRHVHILDSADDGSYRLAGEGSAPIDDVVLALNSIDYDGFVSMEWMPEWMPAATDPEVIFPHFETVMSLHIRRIGRHEDKLFPNHDGTGYYIWKKDDLIPLTFPAVLDRVVSEFPDQYAFKYTTLDYTRTYSEFSKDVDDFARALVSLGVRPGCKVAVWATNVPEWFITFWATVKIGAVLVTMNTAYKSHEAEYLLRQSDTHTLVTIKGALDSDYQAIINELCPEIAKNKAPEALHCKRLPFLRNVITVGFRQKGCLTFDDAMARKNMVKKETVDAMAADVRPDDVCNMQYTSGTTGFPKGVMLTHHNVVNNGKCIGDRMGLSTADRMMIQVPMFHCFGMVLSMTSCMTHGATLCPMPYFSAKSSLACINQEKITCFNGVPTMFIAMFNHPDYRTTDFSYMRTGIMAGAGCPPELMKRAASPEGMNMRGIVSVYGQTETAPGCTMSSWTDSIQTRCETVGYPFPSVQCKVIDPQTGEELGPGLNGEFCSRGYNTMKGYYKMPDATAQAVDVDGWMHSGDLACRDENGNYRITGRLKDMIIRGGENLYPKEIEEFLYTYPKVKDVQVIAVPDPKYGEEAMAWIIPKENEQLSEVEIREYMESRLARHKRPRYIAFVNSFPMNAAGKILKYKMREMALDMLGLKNN